MLLNRRRLMLGAIICPSMQGLRAASKEFWDRKEPAAWTSEEKDALLYQSPWARQGVLRVVREKKRTEQPSTVAVPGAGVPGSRPANTPSTGTPTVPIGEPIPPPPGLEKGEPPSFDVLVRWESAQPVRLAGGPPLPEETARFYVIRLKGMPLMRPRPGDDSNPNQGILDAVKQTSRIERKNKKPILCEHLLTGSGKEAADLLLFFPRDPDPITPSDKEATVATTFGSFQLSVKFSLKEMTYRGALQL